MIGTRYKGYKKNYAKIPKVLKRSILREANGVCFYCGEATATTVDHKIPRARGGSNDRSNLVAACIDCNMGKDDQTASEYDK